jgi:kojibiose phosphorylase
MNPWLLEKQGWQPAALPQHNSIFTVCNGYWALKGLLLEDRGEIMPTTIVNGVFDLCNMFATIPPSKEKRWYLDEEHFDQGAPSPSVANLPSPLDLRVVVNNHELCLQSGAVSDFSQSFDLRAAVYHYAFVHTDTRGHATRIEMTRFCDANHWHVAHMRYAVTPLNYAADLRIESGIDGTVRSNVVRDRQFDVLGTSADGAGCCFLQAKTRARGIIVDVGVHTALSLQPNVRRVLHMAARVANETCLTLAVGQTLTFDKTMAICTSDDARRGVGSTIAAELHDARTRGFDAALAAHTATWQSYWDRADVCIEGDDLAQQYLRFCLCHLLAAAPKHTALSVPVKLLTGEYYQGNTFYDSDTYIVPFYTHVMPSWAKNYLGWRHVGLAPGREIARQQGFRGAKFAWQAGPDGEECLGVWWHFIRANIHINGDVVYALMQYADVTGDTAFLNEQGVEILIESARFYATRAEYDQSNDSYHLHDIAGPDEGHCTSTDNFYTNYLAHVVLNTAADVCARVQRQTMSFDPAELEQWRTIARKLRFIFDAASTKVYEQYDGFYQLEDVSDNFFARRRDRKEWFAPVRPYQAIHQPDVIMAMLLYRHEFSDDVFAANQRFYYPRTMNFSSMSYGLNAIACKEVGDMDEAYRNFLITAGMDIDEELTGRHDTAMGMHGTACGGAWLAVVFGFAGVQVRDGVLTLRPRLPRQWHALRFSLAIRGSLCRMAVTTKDVTIAVEAAAPAAVPVVIGTQRRTVSPGAQECFCL